jgi:hypothetical protein
MELFLERIAIMFLKDAWKNIMQIRSWPYFMID